MPQKKKNIKNPTKIATIKKTTKTRKPTVKVKPLKSSARHLVKQASKQKKTAIAPKFKYPWNIQSILHYFHSDSKGDLLKSSLFGIERESLRTDRQGNISQKSHPPSLGSKLTHPYISTDFSEAQLELVSPPLDNKYHTAKFIEELEAFISRNLSQELLWPLSMPSRLPEDGEIPIAEFGTSSQGQRKHIYRRGLALRYSSKMQTICGIHFNFSFTEKFWDDLYEKLAPNLEKQDFISESYMGMARNFLRINWLNTYLFGASPTVDKSFLASTWLSPLKKLNKETYYGKYATSLRMSRIGYNNKSDCQSAIKYENLPQFIHDLKQGLSTPKKEYEKWGIYRDGEQIQLNTNLLQTESEHYSSIRPKQIVKDGETVVQALQRRGVKYLEVRSVDINPYTVAGIDEEYINFLHIVLIYCLFKESPIFGTEEYCEVVKNQSKVAFEGRKPRLKISHNGRMIRFKDRSYELLEELKKVAALLDKIEGGFKYTQNIQTQLAKIDTPELTPSAKILNEMKSKKETHMEFGLRLAKEMFKDLLNYNLSASTSNQLTKMSEDTLAQQKSLEAESRHFVIGYEDLELSTQILIKEALKRKLQVDIIDRNDNFIKLSKGRKFEYIKQATKTDADSYMTFLVMENKTVTKHVLREHNINVPEGKSYNDLDDALSDYSEYQNMKVIVKPVSTNFGIGIQTVPPKNPDIYKQALKNAFKHDSSVIVERFFEGSEYRLLVVGNEVIAVCNRIPANVVGDGKHTVEELIDLKNNDLQFRKPKGYKIQKGKIEEKILEEQKMTFHSIPKKDQQVFLRYNSNVSTGGDPLDATDVISNEYKKLAIRAANSANANICGVDMIIRNPKATPTPENHTIIELNFNPTLYIHAYPYKGEPRNVAGPILDFLGF